MTQERQKQIEKIILFLSIIAGIVIGCASGFEMMSRYVQSREDVVVSTRPAASALYQWDMGRER